MARLQDEALESDVTPVLASKGHRSLRSRECLAAIGVAVFLLLLATLWIVSIAREEPSCVSSSSVAPSAEPLVIYYWPELARAAALFRMCDAAGQPYVHNSSQAALASVVNSNKVHGPNGTAAMFAPPVLQDGNFFVSQSVAATLYLGQKLGFDRSVPSIPKAVQHLNDLQDFTGECSRATASLQSDRNAAPLRAFVEGGRFTAWVGTLEHAIVGPFYYGDAVSFVDFYFLQTLDWFVVKAFDPLQNVTGNVWQRFPKVMALHNAMRAMPSYGSTGATGPLIPNVFTDDDVALYAKLG